jgi:hypothetical protein
MVRVRHPFWHDHRRVLPRNDFPTFEQRTTAPCRRHSDDHGSCSFPFGRRRRRRIGSNSSNTIQRAPKHRFATKCCYFHHRLGRYLRTAQQQFDKTGITANRRHDCLGRTGPTSGRAMHIRPTLSYTRLRGPTDQCAIGSTTILSPGVAGWNQIFSEELANANQTVLQNELVQNNQSGQAVCENVGTT